MSITYEYSSIFTAAFLVAMTLMTTFAMLKPRLLLFPYLIMLLMFTGTQYGARDVDLTVYSRGIGVLSFPLVNIFLYVLFAAVFIRRRISRKNNHPPAMLDTTLLLMVTIIFVYYLYGLAADISLSNMVSQYGLINIINLYALYLMMRWWISDDRQLDLFIKVFIYVTSLMALYGVLRWGLFGGDPANYYLNFGGQATRLTYFDSGQGVLFSVLFVILYNRARLSLDRGFKRWFYYFMMGLCLANIMLSFRRSLWFGLGLVFLWIFATSNVGRKFVILGVALMALAFGSVIYKERFDTSYQSRWATGITSDITTKSGNIDLKEGRFSELYAAVGVANQHALLGLGPWGINSPRVTPLKEHDFVHSSIIQVYIKTGLVGVAIYVGMLISYVVWWLRVRRRKWKNHYYRLLGDAFFCGFLVELPDILFGTPLTIFRHSQIIAIIFSIPYVCLKLDSILQKGDTPTVESMRREASEPRISLPASIASPHRSRRLVKS